MIWGWGQGKFMKIGSFLQGKARPRYRLGLGRDALPFFGGNLEKVLRRAMRLLTIPFKDPDFFVSHSQITTTLHPKDRSCFSTRLSRRTFEVNFAVQNGDEGADAFGQSRCLCQ